MEQVDLKQKQSSPSRGLSDQLQAQLHEQFATSDNEKSERVVSFIGSVAFVFTGYGFAIWNYGAGQEHKTQLVAITLAACFVLSLLAWLCVNFGYTLRRDQFIMHRIRQNAMHGEYAKVFGGQFDPRGKCPMTYLVGYYFIIFLFLNLAILGLYFMSICITESYLLKASVIINPIVNFVYFIHNYCKYQNIEKNF